MAGVGGVGRIGRIGRSSTGGSASWRLSGSALDADFVNNRIFGAASIASALPITRSSVGYADDASGVWSSFLSGALRLTNKGLLIEEGRTNGIRNSAGQGAANGSPGTMPTNWEGNNIAGLTRTVVGSGVENGIEYVDIRLNGVTNSTFALLAFENTSAIAASAGQTWSLSTFCALVGGSLANVTNVQLILREVGAGGSATVEMALNGTLTRQPTATRVCATGTTGLWPTITILFASGAAVDFTLRIGWPQVELGAFATSPIRTTSAAVARASDAVTLNSPTTFFDPAAGTVFVEWEELLGPSVIRYLWRYRVDGNNYLDLSIQANGRVAFLVTSGGVQQAAITSVGSVAVGGKYKAAVRWGASDFAARFSSSLGAAPANVVTGTPPAGAGTFGVGNNGNSSTFAMNFLRRLALFTTGRTDAQLNALVA